MSLTLYQYRFFASLILLTVCPIISGNENLRATGNYTCDALTRWIGTEKHYSNHFKQELFGLLRKSDCSNHPYIFMDNVYYGCSAAVSGSKKSFHRIESKLSQAVDSDENAVILLSNYSINNNFSHFLHALLRLFCALIDAGWIGLDASTNRYRQLKTYTIWVDEWFKISARKRQWISPLGINIRQLPAASKNGVCIKAQHMLYGSGCLKLLPPEKWFGYPGCRANKVLPAFGSYYRDVFEAPSSEQIVVRDEAVLKIVFTCRGGTSKTGSRTIKNLGALQNQILHKHRVPTSMQNVTYEHLDVPTTVKAMAGTHIIISIHGAGMTNTFFMNPGSAVIEIIPFPLCTCKSPDFFYGVGSYYHGSAVAQSLKHYTYCVPQQDTAWHIKPQGVDNAHVKCSWRHLHAVESVYIDPHSFIPLLQKVERDLVATGVVILGGPIVNMNSHANG